jgi:hypothetical protein
LLKGAPLQPDKGIGRRQGNRGEDSMNNTTLDRGCQLAAKLIHITAGKREKSMIQASSSRRKKQREQRDFPLVQTKEDIMKQAEGTINGEVVLNMVLEVWAEMLRYTAYLCSGNYHAKHLAGGGEVISVITLLMIYMKMI